MSPKRKILFYGDSFVRGVSDPEYEIPRNMHGQLDNTAVVDLSCGGYGVGQMFLMFQETHRKVRDPLILVGLYVDDDLGRSVLSVRTGQKPYFSVRGERLKLEGVPVDPDSRRYFSTHPPEIRSYLVRLISRKFFQHFDPDYLRKAGRQKKIAVNRKIIEEWHSICRRQDYPLIFVLFYSMHSLNHEIWQAKFVRALLKDLNIPYIDTKYFLKQHLRRKGMQISDFYVLDGPGRFHHNNIGNKVIADAILGHLKRSEMDEKRMVTAPGGDI